MKIKDFYLNLLSESQGYFHLDSDCISEIKDVDFSKIKNYVHILFTTSYGKEAYLIARYSEFKKWFLSTCKENKCESPWIDFVKTYIAHSKPSEKIQKDITVNEIIDDEGNIMPDDDTPNNATNSHVGIDNNWDLERTARTLGKDKYKYYSGSYGQGFVTW